MNVSGRLASSGALRHLVRTNVLVAFGLLAVIAAIPVFTVSVAPLSDYVNHLARMQVIAVGDADPYFSAFYRIDWQIIPNLAMDLVVPALAKVMNIYLSGQIFMAAVLLLLASGPIAIRYAIDGKLNLFPLTAFLFLYNQIFLVGVINYIAGAGVAMWGLAAWITMRERPLWRRMLVSAGFVLVLFVCHLSALGLYGLAIGSYELWVWSTRRFRFDRKIIVAAAALILPVLPVIPLLISSATWSLASEYEWNAQGKLDGLLMIVRAYSDTLDIGILCLLAIAFVWALRHRLVSFHPAGIVLVVLGSAAYMAMPAIMFGSYMADQRLPIAIFLMFIGFGRLRTNDLALKGGFIALVVAFSAIRAGDVAVHWHNLSRAYAEFRQATNMIERGSKILVAYSDDPQSSENDREAISHAACLAMIEKSALVSTAFTVKGKQIMSVRHAFADRVDTEDGTPPVVSQLIASTVPLTHEFGNYWDGWREKHDYVTLLYTEKGAPNPNPGMLSLVYDGLGFQLYRILR